MVELLAKLYCFNCIDLAAEDASKVSIGLGTGSDLSRVNSVLEKLDFIHFLILT